MEHITWEEEGGQRSAQWRSEAGVPPPKRVQLADDRINADAAYKLACEGTALLWRGDFQNARQLLQALARRIERAAERGAERKPKKKAATAAAPAVSAASKPAPADAFHRHRAAQAQRARILGMLLIPFEPGHVIPLRRAPDVQAACEQAYGAADEPYVASLRELLGLIGAYEWRKKGVEIPALGARIHPHYGVFSPVRGEYVDLVAQAPLPATTCAFDIGTGTGVLAALLAKRGIKHVVATDQDPRALACARENIERLGYTSQIALLQADLFPPGRAPLIICNPPWLPAKPSSPIEYALYDPDSRMLRGYLNGLAAHLEPGGEGWLILSDFAEHLGLRTCDDLLNMIAVAGLEVIARLDANPRHSKASDANDPLHAARKKETTSLWRLKATA